MDLMISYWVIGGEDMGVCLEGCGRMDFIYVILFQLLDFWGIFWEGGIEGDRGIIAVQIFGENWLCF